MIQQLRISSIKRVAVVAMLRMIAINRNIFRNMFIVVLNIWFVFGDEIYCNLFILYDIKSDMLCVLLWRCSLFSNVSLQLYWARCSPRNRGIGMPVDSWTWFKRPSSSNRTTGGENHLAKALEARQNWDKLAFGLWHFVTLQLQCWRWHIIAQVFTTLLRGATLMWHRRWFQWPWPWALASFQPSSRLVNGCYWKLGSQSHGETFMKNIDQQLGCPSWGNLSTR